MKYNQNFRISHVIEKTLMIGVDIAKKVHFARTFNFLGIEFAKSFRFKSTSKDIFEYDQKVVLLYKKME